MKSNSTTTQSSRTSAATGVETRLAIVVPYTTPELTLMALKHACTLSRGLNATVRIIDAQVVPVQRPLGEPPVNREFQKSRLRKIAEKAAMPVEVEIIYTRNRMECFRRMVDAHSLIVIASATAGMSWWPAAEKKLARLLLRAGYDVVLVPRAQERAL